MCLPTKAHIHKMRAVSVLPWKTPELFAPDLVSVNAFKVFARGR